MTADLLTKPSHGDTGTGDPNEMAHYIKKEYATDAYVFGHEVEALCGFRLIPHRNPERFPICPECKEIRDAMPLGDGE